MPNTKDLKEGKFYNTHDISSTEYNKIHHWLRTNFKKLDKCEGKNCKGNSNTIQWALKKGKDYAKVREYFLCLCKSCHTKYDMTEETKKKIGLACKGRIYKKEKLVNRLIPVLKFDLDGKFIKRFPSVSLAAASVNGRRTCIITCARGRSETSYGYKWKYENKYRKTK